MTIVAQMQQPNKSLILNDQFSLDLSAAVSCSCCPDPRSSSLGTIAEFSSACHSAPQNDIRDRAQKDRYQLLKTAARLLPDERIANCMSAVAPLVTHVTAWHDPDEKSAGYRDLQRCESDSCPFCAYARSESQRHKLVVALASAQKRDLYPLLVTLTLRHRQGEKLADVRAGLLAAYNRMFSGRAYQRLKDEYLIVGKVRSEEQPYGVNGWHPHLHVLLFTEMELVGAARAAFEAELRRRWQAALEHEGRYASFEHGLDVRNAESDIADYVAKWGHEPLNGAWGVDSELARSTVKQVHQNGLTPFQLLGAATGLEAPLALLQSITGIRDKTKLRGRGASLYIEYFHAYKGKSRFHWGKDLIAALDLENELESFTQQNRPGQDNRYDMLLIDREVWKHRVLVPDLRADLLIMVRSGDIDLVRRWLDEKHIPATITHEAQKRQELTDSGSNRVLHETGPQMPKNGPGGENDAPGEELRQSTLFDPSPEYLPSYTETAYSRSFIQNHGDMKHERSREVFKQPGRRNVVPTINRS